jgi:hypothetical protein
MNDIYLYIMLTLTGFLLGIGLTLLFLRIKVIGVLRVDSSDSREKPYLFLEFEKQPERLSKRHYVILKVNPNSYISQK